MKWLEIGTPLHDIGKLAVPEHLLKAPRKLSAEEFDEMKQHTIKGELIVSSIPDLHPIVPIVLHHHHAGTEPATRKKGCPATRGRCWPAKKSL